MHERRVMLPIGFLVRSRESRGQTAAEYLGVLLVVAALVTALLWSDPGQEISGKLSELVRDIAGER
jgi:hypothetical protein